MEKSVNAKKTFSWLIDSRSGLTLLYVNQTDERMIHYHANGAESRRQEDMEIMSQAEKEAMFIKAAIRAAKTLARVYKSV